MGDPTLKIGSPWREAESRGRTRADKRATAETLLRMAAPRATPLPGGMSAPASRPIITCGDPLPSGEHKGHPALRAFQESNRVWRDENGNFKPDEGECVFVGTFGVNIHAGGSTNYIGKWSAGCINVFGGWEGRPWKALMESVGIHFQDRSFLYITVWRGRDLVKFKELGWAQGLSGGAGRWRLAVADEPRGAEVPDGAQPHRGWVGGPGDLEGPHRLRTARIAPRRHPQGEPRTKLRDRWLVAGAGRCADLERGRLPFRGVRGGAGEDISP